MKTPKEHVNSAVKYFRQHPEAVEVIEHLGPKSPGSGVDEQSLSKFLQTNELLQALSEKLEEFNLFDALNAKNQEIRHSNFLAWLFNPEESHRQGAVYLASLLELLARGDTKTRLSGLSERDLEDVEVRREFKNIDLVLVFQRAKHVVVVENKIHASQRPGQLTDYRRMIEEDVAFAGFGKSYVFLTLKSETPEDLAYFPVTFADLSTAFRNHAGLASATSDEAKEILLRHYLALLEGNPGTFNVFKALRAERKEIRHSDFLAWCLDPSRSGTVGESMARQFFALIPPAKKMAEVKDFSDLEIFREHQGIDLLLVSERHRFVSVVENKVKSRETGDQLKRYRELTEAQYAGFDISFVFLTMRDQVATDSAYHTVSYHELKAVVQHGIEILAVQPLDNRSSLLLFVDHYLNLIRTQLKAADQAKYRFAPDAESLAGVLWQRHSRDLGGLIVALRTWRVSVRNELAQFLWALAQEHFTGCLKSSSKFQKSHHIWLRFIPCEILSLRHFERSSSVAEFNNVMPHYTFHNLPFGYKDVPRTFHGQATLPWKHEAFF